MATAEKAKISVIVPTYNEKESVLEVLKRLLELNPKLFQMEIVVVDDGSVDGTDEKLTELNSPLIKLVHHTKNMGKGAAIRTGINKAIGDVVVIQDADLEYRPEDIPKLVDPILKGKADVVYGSRFKGEIEGMRPSHLIGNAILSFLTRLLFCSRVTDVMTGHKAFLRKIFKSFKIEENGFTVEIELTAKIIKKRWRLKEVPIIYSYRKWGEAKINFMDGIKCAFKLVKERIRPQTHAYAEK